MIGIKDVNSFYSEKYGGIQIEILERELTPNPYEDLLNWIRCDILDLRGIIESIQKRQETVKLKSKFEERLEGERDKLAKIQSGKKSISQIFSQKSKEDHASKTESDIKQVEEEIEGLNFIINISTARLVNEIISEFKESKTRKFEYTMKCFTDLSIKEFSIFINEAKQLESKLS